MLTAKQLAQLRREPAPVGNRIKAARQLHKLTQVQLSAAIGLPQSQISEDETGNSPAVTVSKAWVYAQFFGCQLDDLFPARETVAQ